MLLALVSLAPLAAVAQTTKPNVIIILTDDQGYQDLGCFGSPDISTPRIDKMAEEGLKLTSFYVSASVSSASRAGLLTGRLNTRNSVKGVFWPDQMGMNLSEKTLAKSLRDQGYATACIGKWHLGDREGRLPMNRGFDEYFGMPYSNDMFIGSMQQFADDVNFREGYTIEMARADQEIATKKNGDPEVKKLKPKVPLFEGDKIVEYPCDQSTTTRRYFDRAIDFIERNSKSDKPFFAYITPAMPHYPLFASDEFKGRSKRGLYGDVVEEIDFHVGRLLDYLDEKGLSENTLIIFTSDNGPSLGHKDQGGTALPLRDGKFSHYEGGVRVPCVMRWSGHIPAGSVSNEIAASIDIYPTVMHYAGVDKFNHHIDGINMSEFLKNPTTTSYRDEYVYVKNGKVHGVRKGDWVYLPMMGNRNTPKEVDPQLFNISGDISQLKNLYSSSPEQVAIMQALMAKYEDESYPKTSKQQNK